MNILKTLNILKLLNILDIVKTITILNIVNILTQNPKAASLHLIGRSRNLLLPLMDTGISNSMSNTFDHGLPCLVENCLDNRLGRHGGSVGFPWVPMGSDLLW